jgi:hypothetical protein
MTQDEMERFVFLKAKKPLVFSFPSIKTDDL